MTEKLTARDRVASSRWGWKWWRVWRLRGGNLLPRAQRGRAQNPQRMAQDSSLLWNPFREQLGFPKFNAPHLKIIKTVRQTSSYLSPNHPYCVGLRGQVINTNQQPDRLPSPLSTCSCPDFKPESPRQERSCSSSALDHYLTSNTNLHLNVWKGSSAFVLSKKKKPQSLFSLKNKKVTKVQEKGNKQLFAQGYV